MTLRAKYLRVRPDGVDGRPVLEIELTTGEIVLAPIDRGHGRAVANRIVECIDGRIAARSSPVLELEFPVSA